MFIFWRGALIVLVYIKRNIAVKVTPMHFNLIAVYPDNILEHCGEKSFYFWTQKWIVTPVSVMNTQSDHRLYT